MTTLPVQALRHVLTDEEQRSRLRTDANTFRLQQQFMRAHGAPRGQLTMLVTTSIEGSAFLSSVGRPR